MEASAVGGDEETMGGEVFCRRPSAPHSAPAVSEKGDKYFAI